MRHCHNAKPCTDVYQPFRVANLACMTFTSITGYSFPVGEVADDEWDRSEIKLLVKFILGSLKSEILLPPATPFNAETMLQPMQIHKTFHAWSYKPFVLM